MLVDKKKFKELKKNDGGLLGREFCTVVEVLEAEDLKKVSTCNIDIYPKSIYMDFLFSYKLYFSLENLSEVKLNNDIIEIYIENELPIKIKFPRVKDLIKAYKILKGYLGEEAESIDVKSLNCKATKENEKFKRKLEMERLRNAGRTVHPSEQRSNPIEPKYDNNVVRCPKCKSTSITANKKGFSLAKGALGVATVGLYGVVAAGHGKNKVIITCLNCGHQWKAGK